MGHSANSGIDTDQTIGNEYDWFINFKLIVYTRGENVQCICLVECDAVVLQIQMPMSRTCKNNTQYDIVFYSDFDTWNHHWIYHHKCVDGEITDVMCTDFWKSLRSVFRWAKLLMDCCYRVSIVDGELKLFFEYRKELTQAYEHNSCNFQGNENEYSSRYTYREGEGERERDGLQ